MNCASVLARSTVGMQIEPLGDKQMQRERKQYSAPLLSTKPGKIKALRGMRDRGATDVPGKRVKRGLLNSASPQDKVRLGLPQHALRFIFPQLWPKALANDPDKPIKK